MQTRAEQLLVPQEDAQVRRKGRAKQRGCKTHDAISNALMLSAIYWCSLAQLSMLFVWELLVSLHAARGASQLL